MVERLVGPATQSSFSHPRQEEGEKTAGKEITIGMVPSALPSNTCALPPSMMDSCEQVLIKILPYGRRSTRDLPVALIFYIYTHTHPISQEGTRHIEPAKSLFANGERKNKKRSTINSEAARWRPPSPFSLLSHGLR